MLFVPSAPEPQWCGVCCSKYSSCLSSHLSSTLHQFSLHRPSPTPYYCLPPSSNSYKMMVRCGWKPGAGLGPEGEGPQQPVPTVLKRDHQGLGYGQMERAKVTHFQARDRDAVKPPSRDKEEKGDKGQRKKESRRKEQKDKNWERDFRASFYLWHLLTVAFLQVLVVKVFLCWELFSHGYLDPTLMSCNQLRRCQQVVQWPNLALIGWVHLYRDCVTKYDLFTVDPLRLFQRWHEWILFSFIKKYKHHSEHIL